MRPNLILEPAPASGSYRGKHAIGFAGVATCAVVLTLTAGIAPLPPQLNDRLTLQPIAGAGPHSTAAAANFAISADLTPPESTWLQDTIEALLAEIPEAAWSKVPSIYVADIDKRF